MKQVIIGEALVSSGVFRSQEFPGPSTGVHYLLNENVTFHDGIMDILARSNYKGHTYTSGRVTTKAMKEFGYGTFTFRLKLPWVRGAWCGPWAASGPEEQWPYYPEWDICEANKRGVKGLCSNGLICNPPPGDNLDLAREFNMSDFGAEPDGWNDWTMEINETYCAYRVNGILYRTIFRAELDAHRQSVWGTPRYFLIDFQISKSWAGNPSPDDYITPVHLLCEAVTIDEKVTQVEVPSLPGNPMPEQGEDMNITLLDTKKVQRTNKDPEYHLTWALDGTPSSDVKLVIDGPGWGAIKFLTTGLAHIYVPQTWTKFSYWLEGPDFLGEQRTHFFGAEPDPVVDPTSPDPITALRATANIMRSQAETLDKITDELENAE